MKKIKKIIISIICMFMPIAIFHTNINIQALEQEKENNGFIALDKEGNVSIIEDANLPTYNVHDIADSYQVLNHGEIIEMTETYEEAQKVVNTYNKGRAYSQTTIEDIMVDNPTYGIVVFRNDIGVIDYTNASTGVTGYLAASYAPDAAYLGKVNDKVKFKIAGVTGLVDSSKVYLVDYDKFASKGLYLNTYSISDGYIYHNITTDLKAYQSSNIVGYKQSYMTNGHTYYSYDGHYLYTNYKVMIDDYKNNRTTGAINNGQPYYNYYQFLSHRSKTGFTSDQLNEYLNKNISINSKLYNSGNDFINNQNLYGINALLMLGVSINESDWGNSEIAQDKSNIFGHGAKDGDAYNSAYTYSNISESIKYHAKNFLSDGYLDVLDYRYFGSHLGDKESGINVKYASDPYWGEKAAARGYFIEQYFDNKNVDYNAYKIGVVSGNESIYKDSNTNKELYSTGNGNAKTNLVSILVLDTVKSNGSNWYKMQSDTPLTANRDSFLTDGVYDFNRDYGYMNSKNVQLVNPDQTALSVSVSVSPDVGYTTKPTTIKINANNATGLQYKYVWMKDDWNSWDIIQDASSSSSVTWVPPTEGKYTVLVDIIPSYGDPITKRVDYIVYDYYEFKGVTLSSTSGEIGKSVAIKPQISGSEKGLQYKYIWMKDNWSSWGLISDLSETSSVNWTPSSVGNYSIIVDVQDRAGAVTTQTVNYTAKHGVLTFSGIEATPANGQELGNIVTLKANVTGNTTGAKYKFIWMKDNWNSWGIISDLGANSTSNWKPTAIGNYSIIVDVQDSGGKVTSKTIDYQIKQNYSYAGVGVTGTQEVGNKLTVTPSITGNSNGLQYKYIWVKDNWSSWGVIKSLGFENSTTWIPTSEGNYSIIVDVVDSKGTVISKEKSLVIKENYTYTGVVAGTGQGVVNQVVEIKPTVQTTSNDLQYKYIWVKDNWESWGIIKDMSTSNSVMWTPTIEGNYSLIVDIKDRTGKITTKETNYQVKKYAYSKIELDRSETIVGRGVKITPKIEGNNSGLKYKYVWMKDNWESWDIIKDMSASNSVTWTPTKTGTYTLIVDVQDSQGTITSRTIECIVE